MMGAYGLSRLDGLADHIIETSRNGSLAAIAAAPPGQYRSELTVDGYERPVRLAASLTIGPGGCVLDFAGSDPCSAKGINVPLNYAAAYSVFALRCLFAPDIPNNAGSLAPFHVTAPKDCILNAQPPAAGGHAAHIGPDDTGPGLWLSGPGRTGDRVPGRGRVHLVRPAAAQPRRKCLQRRTRDASRSSSSTMAEPVRGPD